MKKQTQFELKRKFKILKLMCDFSSEETKEILNSCPKMFKYSESELINFSQNLNKITKNSKTKMDIIKEYGSCIENDDCVLNNLDEFLGLLNFKLSDFDNCKTNVYSFLTLNYDDVRKQISIIKDKLSINNQELRKYFLNRAQRFSLDYNLICNNLIFLKSLFNFSNTDLLNLLNSNPYFLFKSKKYYINLYNKYHQLDVPNKIDPAILKCIEKEDFFIRYFFNIIVNDEIKSPFYSYSFQRMWARYCFLYNVDKSLISIRSLGASSSSFEKIYKVTDEDLLKKYPLGEKTIQIIKQRYRSLYPNASVKEMRVLNNLSVDDLPKFYARREVEEEMSM